MRRCIFSLALLGALSLATANQSLNDIDMESPAHIDDKPVKVLPVSHVIRKLVEEAAKKEEHDSVKEKDAGEKTEPKFEKAESSNGDADAADGAGKRTKRQINFGSGSIGAQRRPGQQGRPVITQGRPINIFPGNQNRPGNFNNQGGAINFNNQNRPGNFNNQNRPGNFNNQGGGNINAGGGAPQNAQCASGNCVSLAACNFGLATNSITSQCTTPGNGQGVCCPARGPGKNDRRLFDQSRPQVRITPMSAQQVNQACQKGINTQENAIRQERVLMDNGIFVPRNTAARGHARFFNTTRTARSIHASASRIAQASKNMMNDLNLTSRQGGLGLRQVNVRNSILGRDCPATPSCNRNSKYRTIDGSCNNNRRPLYGRSETAFNRILPPVYDDGVSSPRTRSVGGGILPNVRTVASSVLVDRNDEDQQFTLSVMQWGQFVDHDLTHAPFIGLPNGEPIECCINGQEAQGQARHPECLPISIPNDRFYNPRGVFCMNFVRSMLGLNQDCTFGYAEQMNQITHWLDGSNIYGSNEEEAERLRSNNNGLLILGNGRSLPLDPVSGGECEARQRGGLCFIAGDSRVNEQPGLTAIHTFWHREHNRVAAALRQMHPRWSDEALYQQARRIVVAQMQHIIFNEWLPIIVGERFMDSFGINVLQSGYSQDYNEQINPNMNNEFATGAFRFGHSLVQGTISLRDRGNTPNTIQLREHFNSPHIFQGPVPVYDHFARAFSRQAIQKFDSFVTDDLSNHLFQTPTQNFGMDLMSLNLQRGRDHAIATYNSIREVCGLPRARTFSDFNDQIPIDIVQRLSQLYAHPDDVDYFVGGMSEKPVSGGLLGWTFLCVVGDQFARVKKGDRFFYDLGGQPGSFSPAQLQEIRKASWARILCDNSDNLQLIQPLAFKLPDNGFNRVTQCNSGTIPRLNLAHWRAEDPRIQ